MKGASFQALLTSSGSLASRCFFPSISRVAAILGVTGPLHSAWAAPVTYVDAKADFIITTDQGTPSVLDAGDVVSWQPAAGTPVTGLVFGTDAFTSVQAAINAVDASGTVRIAAGTYDEGTQISATSKAMTIEGEGQTLTFLSGGGDGDPATANPSAHRVLQVGANVTLSNLAIVDGELSGANGAGVYGIFAANVVITNSTISGNATDGQGGGIFSNISSFELIECTIKENVAGTYGGGVYTSGRLRSRRCLFQNNSAGAAGGGVYLNGSGFDGTDATTIAATKTLFHNTTFSGNGADEQGGGAFLNVSNSKEYELRFCTFTGNSALISEGGIWATSVPYEDTYSLIVGNSAPMNPETNVNLTNSSATTSLEQAGVESLGELLAPLADNGGPTLTHELLPGNNAVDAIYLFDPYYLPQTDQRGLPRFYGPDPLGGSYSVGADLGAYEINEVAFTSVPRDGATNAAIDSPISFTFNGTFTFDNLEQIVLRREGDNAAIPFIPSTSGSTLTLTPLAPLTPGESYHVEFNAAIATNSQSEVYGPVVGNVIGFQTYTATEVYVDDAGDFVGDGPHVTFKQGTTHEVTGLTLGVSAFTDVQTALDHVAPGGTVHIGDGTYDAGSELLIRNDVNWVGLGIGHTILSGGSTHRVVRLQTDRNVRISDLTLTQGNATLANLSGPGKGGAIYASGSSTSLQLERIEVSDNSAEARGGGIYLAHGTLTIQDSQITANATVGTDPGHGMGGGIFLDQASSALIERSTLKKNVGWGDGGAIAMEGGSLSLLDSALSDNTTHGGGAGISSRANSDLSLTRCQIAGNVASGDQGGGGIDVTKSSAVTIRDSTLSGNQSSAFHGSNARLANGGGALCVSDSSYGDIYNSTISGNSATGYGGGFYAGASQLELNHTTVIGNTAGLGGGAVIASKYDLTNDVSYSSSFYHLTLNNSLVAGNTGTSAGPDLYQHSSSLAKFTLQGRNFVGNLSGTEYSQSRPTDLLTYTEGQQLSDLVETGGTGTPTFVDNGGPTRTIALVAGSPAINAGVNASLPGTEPFDQRGAGYYRISGGTIDLGAFEFEQPTPLLDWRILHGLDPSGADDLGNPSGDGVENILKYAFNMAPLPEDLLASNTAVLAPGGISGLPLIEVSTGPRLSITYVRRKTASAPSITYRAMSGEDLIGFGILDPALETVTSIDSIWERVTIVDPVISSRRFGFLDVMN